MRAAEEALIAAGSSVDVLMAIAGRGAAEYVWRLAAHRRVTVLTGPGNNGGDGWVIAETIRQKGGAVVVLVASEPKTDAARNARSAYGGVVLGPDDAVQGEVLVDCLYGSGLTRGLGAADFALLGRLAASHPHRIAIDVPSGVESDSGACLNNGLPDYQLTVSLGAWKFAHFLMPAAAKMGELRLVGIGCAPVPGAASVVRQPALHAPAPDAHKYRRGLLGVVAGEMPGATVLAARAAQGAGAGYVKLLALGVPAAVPPDLVLETGDLAERLRDPRFSALLVGPGLGRDKGALLRLQAVLKAGRPAVLDADALMLLRPDMARDTALIATPHEGELAALESAFRLSTTGSKVVRAQALARASGMVIVAKGPDTVIAAPDGRIACASRASSWLSTAGTGDVLAGCIASRLACGVEAFGAAGEGVWLHGEAARRAPKPFSASALAEGVPGAYAAAL
jgi:hydroxyethylthiazole kinase-like uncharacterized protein yjeF